jgi:hypothetical protein
MEVNGVGNSLFDVERGGGSSQQEEEERILI